MIFMSILLAFHLFLCVCIFAAVKAGMLKIPPVYALQILFLPIWGELCALSCHVIKTAGKDGKKELGVERLETDSEIYRSVYIEAGDEQPVVALEEALIINDSEMKRSMLMNILSENPDNYMGLLKTARKNEDVEVVHYATTATTEIAKEYELQLQRAEADYMRYPEDEKCLKRYTGILESYIGKELAQGQYLIMQRNQYSVLLQKQIDRYGDLTCYCKKTENELELDNYGEASKLLEEMERRWPEKEEVWLLWIRYYAQQGEGRRIQEVIRQIREREIFLTSAGVEVIEFWDKGGLKA